MSKEIKIGIFGLSRGMNYGEIMKNEDAIEVIALCDKRPRRLELALESIPTAKGFEDFDEFLAWGKENGMNAVFLANYFHEHAPFAVKVMEAGMYAISECLPAATLKECVDLVEAVEKGGKYMFAENYPFMPGNLELSRLCHGGTLGTVMYLEGEYNHHDPADCLYDRSKGKYHWRNWEPRCYYISHSMAPLMMMVDGMPKYISCMGAISQMMKEQYAFRASSEGMAQIMCKFDNGSVARFSGCNSVASNYSCYRAFGDKGAAEWGGNYDDKVRLSYKYFTLPSPEAQEVEYYYPDFDKLDSRLHKANEAGHGGSDYMVVQNMISFIRDGVKPYFDVYKAAAIAATAVYALRSMLNNGEQFVIPDFKNVEERNAVRNDDLTPFYHDNGEGGTINPTIDWTPDRFAQIDDFKG